MGRAAAHCRPGGAHPGGAHPGGAHPRVPIPAVPTPGVCPPRGSAHPGGAHPGVPIPGVPPGPRGAAWRQRPLLALGAAPTAGGSAPGGSAPRGPGRATRGRQEKYFKLFSSFSIFFFLTGLSRTGKFFFIITIKNGDEMKQNLHFFYLTGNKYETVMNKTFSFSNIPLNT